MQKHNKKKGHLSQEERVEIYALRKQGVSFRGIGRKLQRDKNTIRNEIARNGKDLGWGRYDLILRYGVSQVLINNLSYMSNQVSMTGLT